MLTETSLSPPGDPPGGTSAVGSPGWRAAPLTRDPHEFLVNFLPSETRVLTRTGVELHNLSYWTDALSPLVGRKVKVRVYYDPRTISRVHVRLPSGVLALAPLTTPNVPDMSLGEWAIHRQAERRVCNDPARLVARAQSRRRAHAVVVSAQARRRSLRRRASAAAGDVWLTEASPPQAPGSEPPSTQKPAISSDVERDSGSVPEPMPTLAATPTYYAIEENDDEL